MNKNNFLVFSACSFLLLFKVFAASASGNDRLVHLSLEELLNVPIVTATTFKEKPSDTPASAIVISEEIIKDRGYSSLLELLEDIPQIEIGHHVTAGNIRSLTVMGINGIERFQVMIDGVRATPLTGNLLVLGHQFSLANAKQVEIILGPMSSLYGADVFSGVINIVTKSGNEGPEGTISTEFGDFRQRNFSLIAKLRPEKGEEAKNHPALSITTNRFFTDGPFMPKYYPKEFTWYNNQFQSGRVLNSPGSTSESKVPFTPFSLEEQTDFLHARLNFRSFEFGLISMTETHSSSVGVLPQFTIYGESTIFRTRYNTIYGKYTHTSPDNRWNLQSQVSHQFYEVSPETNFINNFSSYKPAYKYARDKSWSIEERYSLKIRENRHLTLGLTYQKHDSLPRTADLSHPLDRDTAPENQGFIYPGSDLGTLNPNGIPLKTYKFNYENVGGYAQMHLNPDSRYQVILGARFDDNSLYGSSFNPRIGVVYKPDEKSNCKLLYGTAFLAPPPDKTYAHFGSFVADPANPGAIKSYYMHVPNPDLKPEKIGSLQAEYSYKLRQNKKLTLSIYDSHIADLHQVESLGAGTSSGQPVDTLAHWTNLGNARAYGGSLRYDAICSLKKMKMNLFAAYSYSNGDVAGNPLPYSARHSGRFGLTLKEKRWTVSPRVIHQGKSYLQFKDSSGKFLTNKGFTTANLFVKYRLSRTSSEESSLFLNVQNLFDKRYYNPGFADGSVGFSNAPQYPRFISGGLRLEF